MTLNYYFMFSMVWHTVLSLLSVRVFVSGLSLTPAGLQNTKTCVDTLTLHYLHTNEGIKLCVDSLHHHASLFPFLSLPLSLHLCLALFKPGAFFHPALLHTLVYLGHVMPACPASIGRGRVCVVVLSNRLGLCVCFIYIYIYAHS